MKKKSVYRDALHELVKPILVNTPTDTKKRRQTATRLRASARQEVAWASSADLEGRAERRRALKLKRNDPLRAELLADSRIAYSFGKIRLDRANKLNQLADSVSRSLKPKRGKK